MAKDQTVAPQERVNITYKPATGDRQSEVELPLKMLFIGDYTGRADDRTVEDRKPVNIDKDNFNQVLAEQNVGLQITVPNRLTQDAGGELSAKLQFKKLSDFGPDAVAEQIPELKALLELRAALTALKGPLGNLPAFRKALQAAVSDPTSRDRLLRELGVEEKGEG